MIRLELSAPGRARVIGALSRESVSVLLDATAAGVGVFDLSEVDKADESAVRVLAGLSPEICALVSCPRWLDLWIERLRGAAG